MLRIGKLTRIIQVNCVGEELHSENDEYELENDHQDEERNDVFDRGADSAQNLIKGLKFCRKLKNAQNSEHAKHSESR